jgi:ATP-dependent DNA helicase RecQ
MQQPLDILQRFWGYEQFRPLQAEIIQAVLAGKDTLAIMPTGGGKSICFQVPALVREGMALVFSPLIALMKDQVERLNRLGIAAAYINSSMPRYLQDEKLQTPLPRPRAAAFRYVHAAAAEHAGITAGGG